MVPRLRIEIIDIARPYLRLKIGLCPNLRRKRSRPPSELRGAGKKGCARPPRSEIQKREDLFRKRRSTKGGNAENRWPGQETE